MPESDGAAQRAALFQERILTHYRRPHNRGTLPAPDAAATRKNPLCGDEITLHLALDDDRVREARFSGQGCSITLATASMMTELARGKTTGELAALGERFAAMVHGDAAAAEDERLGELRALAGVARYPARIPCALMPWQVLEAALDRG